MHSLDIRRAAHPGHGLRGLALALLALAGVPAAGSTDPAGIAREVVSAQVGVAATDVRILAVTPRAFPDGSLGCPVAGMAYAQVVTPGHQVSAEAAGRRFDVRVAGSSGRICHGSAPAKPRPRPPARASGPAAAATSGTLTEQARRDLATVLGLPVDAITVLDTHARGSKEALPGCGPAATAAGESVLVLGADGRQYTYLLRGDVATPCQAAATR